MKQNSMNQWQAVEKPARYSGNEWNIIRKDNSVACRLALAFPNIYEIGMSHLGLRILYDLINKENDLALERLFCPWPDKEANMREKGEKLRTLETDRLPKECDLLGFTLQTELDYTNILTLLHLSDFPLHAAERNEDYPLVIAGGPVAFNPEPIAPFIDVFLIGDAEESLPLLMRRYIALKNQSRDRIFILKELEKLPGVYAPALHDTEIDTDTGFEVLVESSIDSPIITKAMIENLDQHPFPEKMLVPYCDIVHDRVAVEISRGCSRGCRFCQAGVIYMPERRRSPESIMKSVTGMLKNTGYDAVSISALTPNDHPQLESMVSAMMEQFKGDDISLALASLSPSDIDEKMLRTVGGVRKTGLTIAPEAGTQRLRDVINKGITEEHILKTAETAFRLGWRMVKLYFMIGLPTETDEDVLCIAKLAKKVASLKKGTTVKIGCSNFVPKSHTPFQWVAMERREELQRRRKLLLQAISKQNNISFTAHSLDESMLEGVMSRGDRRLSQAIELAWEKGCRFDGWDEHKKPAKWDEAFEEAGIDTAFYCHHTIPPYGRLPWSHIGTGVKTEFIREEYQNALAGVVNLRCKPENCSKCHACPPAMLKEKWGKQNTELQQQFHIPTSTVDRSGDARWFRFRFRKGPELAFLGHLDLARLLARTFRRAEIAVKHSQGFHPQPRISFASALPLGLEARNEYFDAMLYFDESAEELQQRLNDNSPEGLEFTAVKQKESRGKSLSAELAATEYVIAFPNGGKINKESLERFLAKDTLEWTRIHKGKEKRFDIRKQVLSLENGNSRGELRLKLHLVDGVQAKPLEVISAVTGNETPDISLRREQLYVEKDGQLLPPL